MPRPRRALYAAIDAANETARRQSEAVLRAHGFVRLMPSLMWRPLIKSAVSLRALRSRLQRKNRESPFVVLLFPGLRPDATACRWLAGWTRLEPR